MRHTKWDTGVDLSPRITTRVKYLDPLRIVNINIFVVVEKLDDPDYLVVIILRVVSESNSLSQGLEPSRNLEDEMMDLIELDALEADMGMQTEELNLPSAPSGHAVPAGRANPQRGSAEVVRPKSVYGEVVGTLRMSAATRRWPLQSQFEIVERPGCDDACRRCSEPVVDNPARQQRDNKQINKKEQSSHDLQGNNKHY
ncbi:hypothetical protein RHSIM_RhsimUnG0138200 [Rhododendron simsii]|uniref:Uncharacterized protein n=1 Tax=Rhododendron simsii TaxID=118357 RepID=A0A834FWU6_RHOSS|nr:hypothetical protein RHSIM_RhsimUnG0138200 [Rhododendron simsii]